MSRTLNTLTVASILALVASCGGSSTTGPDPDPTGTLAGVVKSSLGDAPLANATVSMGDKQATSGANGAFTLTGLATGRRELRATAAGHAPYAVEISVVAGENQHDFLMLRLTGDLSGSVYRADTGAPLADATVNVGDAGTTSGSDGGFQLSGVPVGAVQIVVTADGYDAYTASFAVQEGDNQHDVHMQVQTFFEASGYGVYIPPQITTVKGVIMFVGGRGTTIPLEMASGEFGPDSHPLAPSLRAVVVGLAEQHELAVIGSVLDDIMPTTLDRVVTVLPQLANAAKRPELAHASLALMGYSWGGCFVSNLVTRHPGRVIGFYVFKSSCHLPKDPVTGLAEESRFIPAQFLIAENDEVIGQLGNQEVADVFTANRAAGSPWSLAVEADGTHEPSIRLFQLAARWFDAVIPLRLGEPGTGGAPALQPLDESAGWLGNLETFVVAPYGSYEGVKGEAAWLPSEGTALDWQAFHPMD